MIEVSIHQDFSKEPVKAFGAFSVRQIICVALAAVVIGLASFISWLVLGEIHDLFLIAGCTLAAGILCFVFYTPHDMSLESYLAKKLAFTLSEKCMFYTQTRKHISQQKKNPLYEQITLDRKDG